MKQTTIHIALEEQMLGVRVFPIGEYPRDDQIKAFELIAPNSGWHRGKTVEPKDGENYDAAWIKAVSERITRVCNNRALKTHVTETHHTEQGWADKWRVRVFWTRPRQSQLFNDPSGIWTLREFQNHSTPRCRILQRISATLGCYVDELLDYLPEGIPHGYEVFADDPGLVSVASGDSTSKVWTFTFQRKAA